MQTPSSEPQPNDDEDDSSEQSRLTGAKDYASTKSSPRSLSGQQQQQSQHQRHHSGSLSHWTDPPSAAAIAALQAPLGDSIELTHAYQEKTTSDDGLPLVDNSESSSPTVREEMPNMVLLVVLYALQGVPLGLSLGSIPFLLQQNVTFTALGYFSFCSWPYSLKLLWSPIVDSVYSDRMGRRKSWIVPIQLVIGAMLVGLSYHIQSWLANGEVGWLTVCFFILITFVATQDIAVDGWAISLLSKRNVGYASTCQSIGQNIGFFLSYTVFLALNEPSFCNRFRSVAGEAGFVDISSYMFWSGVCFLACTGYLWAFKQEAPYVPEPGEDMRVASLYARMWRILQLGPVRSLVLVMLTCRLAFSASDNLTVLKLLKLGFPKETMALLAVLLFPFELAVPVFIGRWASRGNAMKPFVKGYPFKMAACVLGVMLVASTPSLSGSEGALQLSLGLYARVIFVQLIYSLASNVLFVSQCSFFAQVCDSSIGGSYMTLLNTVSNLGSSWPKFFVFAAVDLFSCKAGAGKDADTAGAAVGAGDSPCFGGLIPVGVDGYYVVCGISFVIGIVWFATFRKRAVALGEVDKKLWSCD